MADIRLVRYRNSYGQEIFFDNKTFFAEEIHIGNTSARYNSLSLFNSPGIVTDNYSYEAMPLRFRFALKDKALDRGNRDKVFNAFTSLSPGVITIYTDENEYSIDAHLVAVPDFSRVNSHVWRWEASFIADYPFFRVGRLPNQKVISDNYTDIYSKSPVKVPMIITFFHSTPFTNQTISKGFSITVPTGVSWVRVDTNNFNIVDSNGNNANNCISASESIDDVMLVPGYNRIFCASYSAGNNNTYIEWYDLKGGVL